MVLPAWSLTPSPVAPADLRDFPLPGWSYPTAHQQVPPQVVGSAPPLPCFSTVGLYTATGMLQLPFSSITEEFKVGKARLHLMLWDSPNDIIRRVQPEVRTGTKWSAAKAVQEAEASLQIEEVIGATQTGRAGLASTLHRWFSHKDSRGRRDMVITKLKDDRGREESGHCCWPSQAVRMDELGGSGCQETVTVFPDDYGTPRLVLPSSLHLQPPSHPC